VSGLLVVVGTGIKAVGHMTLDARAWIAQADEVHYVTTDPITEATIRGLSPSAQSLSRFYEIGRSRPDTYEAMTQAMLVGVRAGRTVCAAFYGHPGVFVHPSHEAIRRARAEGLRAVMEPGVSAEDCLFADLGLDPAVVGCAQYEATDFLVYRRRPDPSAALIVWQIGAVGDLSWNPGRTNADNVRVLVEALAATYGMDHVVVVYEAAQLPTCLPMILHVRLADLPLAPLSTASTLFVPPRERRAPDPTMIARLALDGRRFGLEPPR
jgi:Tetrapyrrole (Corrin/Porphyrin) Methylases